MALIGGVGGWWLFSLGIISSGLFVTYILNKWADFHRTPWHTVIVVWIGWWFSFGIVLLIPLDIASTLHIACVLNQQGHEEYCGGQPWIVIDFGFLEIIWKIIYWTTYISCWAIYPILQSYVTVGNFTIWEKLKASLRENLIFYGIASIVGLIVGIPVIVKLQLFNWALLGAICIALGNAWGLLLLVGFLGYGLVEIPKRIWRQSNRMHALKHQRFKVVGHRDAAEKAKKELDALLKLVKQYSESITAEDDDLLPYLDIIIKECPPEYSDLGFGEGKVEKTYEKLVSLRYKLKRAMHNANMTKVIYENSLRRAFNIEDIVSSAKNFDRRIHWTAKRRRQHRFAKEIDFLEFIWKVYIETKILRILAILFSCLSIAVVWSELIFWIEYPNMSMISLLLFLPKLSFAEHWFLVFAPIAYISICSYWSLLKLRIFNYYRMVSDHQSDANSLLFSAMYLCRLGAPMAYNFLLMSRTDIIDIISAPTSNSNWNINNGTVSYNNSTIQETYVTTAFYAVMGKPLTLVDILGNQFNVYVPIIILIMCIFNLFNLWTKFVTNCCVKSFQKYVFDEEASEDIIKEGEQIIAEEKEAHKKRLTLEYEAGNPENELIDPEKSENAFYNGQMNDKRPSKFSKLFGRERPVDKIELLGKGEHASSTNENANNHNDELSSLEVQISPNPSANSRFSWFSPFSSSVTSNSTLTPSLSSMKPDDIHSTATNLREKYRRK